MAAPSVQTRSSPSGKALREGYPIKVAFAADTDIDFWEVTVKPAGIDNGDPIDTTTQFNSDARTKAPRALDEWTNFTITAAYDPAVKTQLRNLQGVEGAITEIYPDGSTYTYYGYAKSFDFDALEHGTRPMVTIEGVVTNWDPSNDVEALPVLASVAGT